MQASVSTRQKHLNTSMMHIGEEILLVNKTFCESQLAKNKVWASVYSNKQ